MITKAVGGILGVGLISVGSIAFSKPEWLGLSREIKWKPLSLDSDFNTKNQDSGGEYKDKFGGKHKNYLTGLDEVNKDWWDEAFKIWSKDFEAGSERKNNLGKEFKDRLDGAFKKISENNDGKKYLNKICHGVYKADSNNIKNNADKNSGTDYKEDDVWRYCSPLGQKPETVEAKNDSNEKQSEKIGSNKASDLISIASGKNGLFWKIKNDEFYGHGVFEGKAKSVEANDKYFTGKKTTNKPISEICKDAYSQSKDTNTSAPDKPTPDEVVKYCSL